MKEVKLRREIEHDDDVLAKDQAKEYIEAFIANFGGLPRDEFEAEVNRLCEQAISQSGEAPESDIWAFWVVTVPDLTMKAYDLLHMKSAGGG